MAKKKTESTAGEALEEIQSIGDRAAEWIAGNPITILGSMAGILVVAGGVGLVTTGQEDARVEASRAYAMTQQEFRAAMGGRPDQFDIPEPANADTARRVREEFVGRYRKVVEEHAGTAAGAFAAIELGEIELDLDQPDAALASWQTSLAKAKGIAAAFLRLRIAWAHEQAGRWAEAATEYEAVAQNQAYPLRTQALGDAARCLVEAGDIDNAKRVASEIAAVQDAPPLPDHTSALLRELEAR